MPLPDTHVAGDVITAADINAIAAAVNALSNYTDEQVRDVIGAALVAGTNMTVTVNDGADTITLAASGSSAGLLGVVAYHPSSLVVYTTTSTTFADVDATNCALTFTAPASGNVLVRVSTIGRTDSGGDLLLGLREGSTDVGVSFYANSGTTYFPCTGAAVVTGLTPGSSHTWKAAFRVSSGATGRLLVGAEYSPLTVEVWAAP